MSLDYTMAKKEIVWSEGSKSFLSSSCCRLEVDFGWQAANHQRNRKQIVDRLQLAPITGVFALLSGWTVVILGRTISEQLAMYVQSARRERSSNAAGGHRMDIVHFGLCFGTIREFFDCESRTPCRSS